MAAAQMDAPQPAGPRVWAAHMAQLPCGHHAFRPGIQPQPVITLWVRLHKESVLDALSWCFFYGCVTTPVFRNVRRSVQKCFVLSVSYGCCKDGVTASQGPNKEGCADYVAPASAVSKNT